MLAGKQWRAIVFMCKEQVLEAIPVSRLMIQKPILESCEYEYMLQVFYRRRLRTLCHWLIIFPCAAKKGNLGNIHFKTRFVALGFSIWHHLDAQSAKSAKSIKINAFMLCIGSHCAGGFLQWGFICRAKSSISIGLSIINTMPSMHHPVLKGTPFTEAPVELQHTLW